MRWIEENFNKLLRYSILVAGKFNKRRDEFTGR